MISYEDAIKLILDNDRLATSTIAINDALAYVAAETISSKVFVPPFNNSAMDGFAVNSKDIVDATKENPIILKLKGSTVAGDRPSSGTNGAWEIMTGAPVPQNYDAVVKIEDVSIKNGSVSFSNPVPIHNNIRDAGEDFKPKDLIIKKGTLITPMHIMALATIGQQNIIVANKPKIIVFSTGKELVENSDAPLKPGQIRNSNSPFLMAALKGMQLSPTYGGIIHDQPEIFEDKVLQALNNNDIIISTGAVSMGAHDFIPDVLHKLGAKIVFHKSYIRPGKPILYARFANGTQYFGLPGNPVSAAVGLRFFTTPLVRHLQGQAPEIALKAPLLAPSPKKQGFRFFRKAHLSVGEMGELQLEILKGQESFKIHPLLSANCWASFSPNQSGQEAGELIEVYPLIPNKWNLESSA